MVPCTSARHPLPHQCSHQCGCPHIEIQRQAAAVHHQCLGCPPPTPPLKPHTRGMHGARACAGDPAARAAGRGRACMGVFSCQGSCPVNSSHRITPYEYTARRAGPVCELKSSAAGTRSRRQPGCARAGRLPHGALATALRVACQACCCNDSAAHARTDSCPHLAPSVRALRWQAWLPQRARCP